MDYTEISKNDYGVFHTLTEAYYREGEDADTPQEDIDAFIAFLFEKVTDRTVNGCFVKKDGEYIGFALWAVDTADFEFSEMPDCGTIMEIGIVKQYRSSGLGKQLVSHVEKRLLEKGIKKCYVSAYGPAQGFWSHCGYSKNGAQASNGLPIMVKKL